MRRAVGILSTTVLALLVAGSAFADSPGPHAGHATAPRGTTGFVGPHTMTGRITDLDKAKGRVTVDAQGEELDLHFPPSALENLSEGEQVEVQLAIKPGGGASGASGSSGVRAGMPGGGRSPTANVAGTPGSRGGTVNDTP